MDYNYLAESLAALAGVPVRIYRDGRFLSLHHTRFKPDFAITEEENIFKIAGDVGYYMDPNFLYYGLFRIRGEDIALVIGPVSPSPVSRNLARKILARMGEPVSRTQEVLDYFSVMPAYPLRNFLQILCTIQYFINGEKVSVSSFLLDEEDPPKLPAFYAPICPRRSISCTTPWSWRSGCCPTWSMAGRMRSKSCFSARRRAGPEAWPTAPCGRRRT